MSVFIMGSSHVKRFEQYVHRTSLSDFQIDGCPSVKFLGISGGRVTEQQHLFRFWYEMDQSRPSHVICHIGGTDMDSDALPEEIILRLLSFLSMCQNQFSIKTITVLQLLPRLNTRTIPVSDYVSKVRTANQILKEQVSQLPHFQYWNLKGMKEGQDTLSADGVHFSDHGHWKYFKNIRAAILKHLNS